MDKTTDTSAMSEKEPLLPPSGSAHIQERAPVIETEVDTVRLQPRIGLFGGITFAVGNMIGSGIFVTPKGALQYVGSVGMSVLVWALCGLFSLILGLVYGELGTLIAHSGGDYTYINKGLGKVPAFLTVWVNTLLANPGAIALYALVFADYLCSPIFDDCGPPESIRTLIASAMILSLLITNVVSVRFAASTQILFTMAKATALIVISVCGVVYLAKGRTENFHNSFEGTSVSVSAYSLATYQILFSYGGYQTTNVMAEELINPKRNIPRAIMLSILFVTMVYVMTNVSYFTMLSKSEFLASTSVAYDWGLRAINPAALFIPISVCCSVYGAANVNSFNTGRIMFAAARNGHFPEVMSYLHVRTYIPTMAVIMTHIFAMLLLLTGNVGLLINMNSFVGFFVSGMSTLSLIRIRRSIPKDVGYRSPLIVPILALLVCIFMVVSPFIHNPRMEFVYGAGFILLGLITYVPFVHFQRKLPGWDHVTRMLQMILQIAPTAKID